MKKFAIIPIIAICSLLFLATTFLISGCGGGETSDAGSGGGGTSDADSGLPPGFAIGTKTSTNVDAAGYKEITEPVSSYIFIFPDGGSGTLTAAKIITAPDRPLAGGEGYSFDYSGDETVKIKIPYAAGDVIYLLGYGALNGSVDDGINPDNRWIALPQDQSLPGFLVFELIKPSVSLSKATANLQVKKAAKSSHQGFSQYWITKIPPNPTDSDKRVAIGLQVKDDIDSWINALSGTLKTNARSEVDGRLKYRMYEDGNYYIGFTRRFLLGNRTTPMLGLKLNVDAQIIAHEVGHYMNHVLTGDALYLALEDTTPDENHGIGVVHDGRITVVEDYAYFSQYFLTGTVGSADPTNPRTMLAGMSPATADFPSVEGFGCVLLASIKRTAPSIIGMISKSAEDVPVVGASFGDIAGIIAKGATNIDTLRTNIEDYLKTRGEESKLPAIAERIGWSYRGSGRIVDSSGAPLSGVTVEAISKVGTTVYTMPSTNKTTTGSDGRFTLSRIFPGQSFIRITQGEQVFDAPITVDWSKPTTELIALGDVPNMTLPLVCGVDVRIVADVITDKAAATYNDWGGVSAELRLGAYSGNTYTGEFNPYLYSYLHNHDTLTFTLNSTRNGIVNFSHILDIPVGYPGAGVTEHVYSSVSGTDIPLASFTPTETRFEIKGTDTCNHINAVYRFTTEEADGYTWESVLTAYRCDSNSYIRVHCR